MSHIYAPEELPSSVVIVGKDGDLALADADLGSQIQHPSKVSVDQSSLQKHFLVARSECSFLSTHASSAALVLAHLRHTSTLNIVFVGVAEGGIEELPEIQVPLDHEVIDM